MVGVAVKVTELPAQIAVADAIMPTEGVTIAVTVIVIALEVGVAGDAQAALDVIRTFTTSPFANAAEVYTGEFVPTLTPFTCH